MRGVPGIIDGAQVEQTIDAIASVQLPDGNIPWTPGGHTDPWNLVEAAMALDLGGRHERAAHAYAWLRRMQHPEGSWHAYYLGDEVEDPTLDTNVACYLATGVWHHYLTTGDTAFLHEYWTVVERAIDYALAYQTDTGEIAWRADDAADGALLTGSSSSYHSLRCAVAIADRLGHDRPDWELSAGALAIAVAHRPERFLDKSRWAMDWYYPILGGVLRGQPAQLRIAAHWDTFVVPGRGVRCVSDQPWVTAAETCELVMTLDALGETERALELFSWVQFLRHPDGAYWCGMNFPGACYDRVGEHFTDDQPTWNSAAVVLAAHALGDDAPTAGLFRGEGIPAGLSAEELIQAGVEIEKGARSQRQDSQ